MFEVLGKMIANSLVQGGPGFPYLAPGIFWYIATGDLSQAVGRSSFIDVGDMDLAAFLERVYEVQYYILRCLICICQPQDITFSKSRNPSRFIRHPFIHPLKLGDKQCGTSSKLLCNDGQFVFKIFHF